MLLCLCHGISKNHIVKMVESGLDTPQKIQKACGAGTSCGICLEELKKLVPHESKPEKTEAGHERASRG